MTISSTSSSTASQAVPAAPAAPSTAGLSARLRAELVLLLSAQSIRNATRERCESLLHDVDVLDSLSQWLPAVDALPTLDNGQTVVLGDTPAQGQALLSLIRGSDLSLSSSSRPHVSSVTLDGNGNVVASSARHIASAAEMNMIESALPPGTTGTASLTMALGGGARIQYTISFDDQALVASKSDLDAAKAAGLPRLAELEQQLPQDVDTLKAMVEATRVSVAQDEKMFASMDKREEGRSDDRSLDARREARRVKERLENLEERLDIQRRIHLQDLSHPETASNRSRP